MLWGVRDSVTCHCNSSQSESLWSKLSTQNPLGQPWFAWLAFSSWELLWRVWILTEQCEHPDTSGEWIPWALPVDQCVVIKGPASFPFCLFQTEDPDINSPHQGRKSQWPPCLQNLAISVPPRSLETFLAHLGPLSLGSISHTMRGSTMDPQLEKSLTRKNRGCWCNPMGNILSTTPCSTPSSKLSCHDQTTPVLMLSSWCLVFLLFSCAWRTIVQGL